MAVPAFRIFRRLGFTAVAGLFVSFGSTALAEDQMVAQMACQQVRQGELHPRVLVMTQAVLNIEFSKSVAPENDSNKDFPEIPFKIQLYPYELTLDLEGDVAAQVKALQATTTPEPEFDLVANGRKDYFNFSFLEEDESKYLHTEFDLDDDYPSVVFIRAPKESLGFRCKRFYLTEYEGE